MHYVRYVLPDIGSHTKGNCGQTGTRERATKHSALEKTFVLRVSYDLKPATGDQDISNFGQTFQTGQMGH